MPTPRKTLHEFAVRDRTFLARRHAYLLEQEPLLEGPRLQRLQLAYRAEPGRLERRAIAVRFEHEVRRTAENQLEQRFAHLPVELLPLGRQRKTLTDRILEGSFQTGRHAWLLAQDTLSETCPLAGRNAAWSGSGSACCRGTTASRWNRTVATRSSWSITGDGSCTTSRMPPASCSQSSRQQARGETAEKEPRAAGDHLEVRAGAGDLDP